MSNDWTPDAAAWKRQYEDAGYLLVENAVEPDLLARMREAMDRIEREYHGGTLSPWLARHVSTDRSRTKGLRTGPVDSDAISNVMELPLFDPLFRDLIVYPRVLDILQALFDSPEFAFHNYKCICKMPGNQAPFQWHRDLPYLQHTSPNLITCMLCLDDMTEENGATVVCPGSHRIPHEAVKATDTDIDESDVPADRITLACPAGSAVLFHVSLVHGGGPNRSASKRRNAISIWSGPDAYPTTAARYAYQSVMPRSQDPMRQKQVEMTFGGR
jgi:ectoine hydroxylase-related dioxygenase (phytanoyl-CoA dioxygenase family)